MAFNFIYLINNLPIFATMAPKIPSAKTDVVTVHSRTKLQSAFKSPQKPTLKESWKYNDLYVEGLQNDVIIMYVTKPGQPSRPAFLMHHYNILMDVPSKKEELNIEGLYFLRNDIVQDNSKTVYGMRCMLLSPGEGFTTKEKRKTLCDEIVNFLNDPAILKDYDYPKETILAKDLTEKVPRSLDTVLNDRDVIKLIRRSFPNVPFSTLSEDEAMEMFFSDVNRGKALLKHERDQNE